MQQRQEIGWPWSPTVSPTLASCWLAECARLGLEGIVAKRKDAPYRSGTRSGWIKVKTEQWKVANRYRTKLFEKAP